MCTAPNLLLCQFDGRIKRNGRERANGDKPFHNLISVLLTFNLVVTSFLDNFFKANFSSSGISFSSSGVSGVKPKIVEEMSTLGVDKIVDEFVESNSAERALLEG